MPVASARKPVRLADLDQSKSHTSEKYREKLRAGHLRLLELQHALKDSNRSVIIIVEVPIVVVILIWYEFDVCTMPSQEASISLRVGGG